METSNNSRESRPAARRPTPRKDGRGSQSRIVRLADQAREGTPKASAKLKGSSRPMADHVARAPRHLDRRMLVGVVGVVAAIVLVVIVVALVRGCHREPEPEVVVPAENPQHVEAVAADPDEGTEAMPAYVLLDAGRTTETGDGRVSFAAFGDNLMNENLLELADAWAGEAGDGSYDFHPFYEQVLPLVQGTYDISFVNQETTMGGTEQFSYSGWPSYNTPDEAAAALVDTGFRLVNTNSNHTYDTWVNSILHDHKVWAQYPLVLTVGSYDSEADRQTVRVVECNGVRISLLSYSYGQNGYEQSDLPNTYYAVPIDKGAIAADVEQAQKVSDFVIVYMHWGDPEYVSSVNDEQRELAQYCADLGVGMVIGSHVHVIQPMEWIDRTGGGQMLCVYGLGDFVSGYDSFPETILSGMFTCDIVRSDAAAAGEVAGASVPAGEGDAGTTGDTGTSFIVENVVWHPLIEHREGGMDVVWPVASYTAEQADANELLATLEGDHHQWILDHTTEVIGSGFTIDQ